MTVDRFPISRTRLIPLRLVDCERFRIIAVGAVRDLLISVFERKNRVATFKTNASEAEAKSNGGSERASLLFEGDSGVLFFAALRSLPPRTGCVKTPSKTFVLQKGESRPAPNVNAFPFH